MAEIAKLINIECMEVDIGKYNSRMGSLSHIVNKKGESLIEGVRLINRYYPNYDPNSLYDAEKQEYYSLEMILNSLQGYEFQNEFMNIAVFNLLIGNTDRYQNNWAILQWDDQVRFRDVFKIDITSCISYFLKRIHLRLYRY